jgi:hypothetical protein
MAVSGAGELSATIGVDDEWFEWAPSSERHAQGGDDERRIEDSVHGPSDNAASEEIDYGNEIQPALASEDASRISGPDLIGAPNAKMSQTVRRNRSTVTTVGGRGTVLGTLSRKDPLLAHEPGDAIAPSRTAEGTSQPWTTIGLATPCELLLNALAQANVLHLPRPRLMATLFPIVIATARNQQRLACNRPIT